ncbi:MAG: formate dehydrogenase accessory protein FdhE [Deltaproteobacteria bacterium]|nr:formate dehydrogenase accessory protein FdhE [Deltaproteobacteria bacterium]
MDFDLKAKLARLATIRQGKPAYRRLLDIYEKIYIEKERCYRSFRPQIALLDDNLIRTKIKEGFFILDKGSVILDMEALEGFFRSLLHVIEQEKPDAGARLAAYFQKNDSIISALIQEAWEGTLNVKSWGRDEIGDPSLLLFMLIECLKPAYEHFGRILGEYLDTGAWEEGYCPICGEQPPISEILPHEERYLFCVFCATEWFFPFFACPFCGYEGRENLRYLRAKNEAQYRIEICNQCGRYIKGVKVEEIGYRVPLDVENILTLHLDMLAQKEGYRRGARFQLLI